MLPLLKRNLQLEPNGFNMTKLESFLLSRAYHSTTDFLSRCKQVKRSHQRDTPKTGARVSRCFPKPIASLKHLVVQNPKIIPPGDTCALDLWEKNYSATLDVFIPSSNTHTWQEGFRNYSALIIPAKLLGEVT